MIPKFKSIILIFHKMSQEDSYQLNSKIYIDSFTPKKEKRIAVKRDKNFWKKKSNHQKLMTVQSPEAKCCNNFDVEKM